MIVELSVAAALMTYVDTEEFAISSCSGEKFALLKSRVPSWPVHLPKYFGTGYVDVRITVDGEGKVVESVITRSVPKRVFDRQSIRALKKWKFNSSVYEERCLDITFKFDADKLLFSK